MCLQARENQAVEHLRAQHVVVGYGDAALLELGARIAERGIQFALQNHAVIDDDDDAVEHGRGGAGRGKGQQHGEAEQQVARKD